jgi:hypothetical protein
MISRYSMLLVLALAGCDGESPTDAGGDDAGDIPIDDGGRDAGSPDAGAGPAPIFRNEDERDDDTIARESLRTMGLPQFGGNPSRCVACHAMTGGTIREWRDLTNTARTACFSNLAPADSAAAAAVIDCFKDSGGTYRSSELGIFSTGAYLPWFEWLFRAGATGDWEEEYQQFQNYVGMPPATHPRLTQGEFDTLTEWFERDLPLLDELLRPVDPVGTCTSYTSEDVEAVLDASELESWSTRNVSAGLLMHGCAGATSPEECLSTYPRVDTIDGDASWETEGTTMRVLYSLDYDSSYWTRSSADGRFVAHGGGHGPGGASVIDLERRVVINVDALYDPGFWPDNSGFVFQGTSMGFSMCETNVLLAGMPTRIRFSEAGCRGSTEGVELYEHVGASLDGDDYFVVTNEGTWSVDPGNNGEDPGITAGASNEVTFQRMTNTGSGFMNGGTLRVRTPFETNAVISPTGRLLVGQIANSGNNIGYVLRRVDFARPSPGAAPTAITLPEIGRYCVRGAKPAFSLDDRWLITHHRADGADAIDLGFSGPDDPGFAPYRGVSNVYLVDLRTGQTRRITNMQPNEAALFPHFRSDGWIYILVRTPTGEHVIASDAALVFD